MASLYPHVGLRTPEGWNLTVGTPQAHLETAAVTAENLKLRARIEELVGLRAVKSGVDFFGQQDWAFTLDQSTIERILAPDPTTTHQAMTLASRVPHSPDLHLFALTATSRDDVRARGYAHFHYSDQEGAVTFTTAVPNNPAGEPDNIRRALIYHGFRRMLPASSIPTSVVYTTQNAHFETQMLVQEFGFRADGQKQIGIGADPNDYQPSPVSIAATRLVCPHMGDGIAYAGSQHEWLQRNLA